jgi:hypothetical protein
LLVSCKKYRQLPPFADPWLLSKVGRVIDVGKEPPLFRPPADQ